MVYATIMAGGKGSRFWPVSREKCPKQFLSLLNHSSFLESTIHRISPLVPYSNILIVGGRSHANLLQTHCLDVPNENIIYEPCGRNTAPCIALAAFHLMDKDPDAIMIVLPADHMIREHDRFIDILSKAIDTVNTYDGLVTIGIPPSYPHTGYGYIEVDSFDGVSAKVTQFHEKPDQSTAAAYVLSDHFFWNSGMFVWKASTILSLMAELIPDQYTRLDALRHYSGSAFDQAFAELDSVSIDYGIMEKAVASTRLIRGDFTWSDIGSWSALDQFLDMDASGNTSHSSVYSVDSTSNIVYSNKPVALIGVDGLAVVDTEDALLVMDKTRDQDVKQLIDKLPSSLL